MNELKIPFSGGLITSRDPADLQSGELVTATGIYYKPGDTGRFHVLPTRGTFGTAGSTIVKGVGLCQFDTGGTDLLLAFVDTTIYSATPGASGSFSSLITSLNSSATRLSICHADDRWYVANGYDAVRVVENNGTARTAGMKAPIVAPVLANVTGAAGTDYRPDDPGSIAWTSTGNARDSDTTTFSYASRSTAGSTAETWDFPANGTLSGTLSVRWIVAGQQVGTGGGSTYGVGGTTQAGYKVTAKLEYSTDGTNYTTLSSSTLTSALSQIRTSQIALTSVTMDNLKVRATLTYTSGTKAATFRIYDIKFSTSASTASFTPTTGYYYAYTEYDSTRRLESAPSPLSALQGGGVSLRGITVTLPASSALQNTNTTHFRVYRTYDGGAAPQTLGGAMEVIPTATATVFTDDFTLWAASDQPLPLLRMQKISTDRDGELFFTLDNDPPALQHISYYKGSLVGTTRDNPRAVYYSEAGYPESWPETNVILKFPMPERDEIIATVTVGDTLLLAATNAMLTMNDLPRVLDGVFNAAEVTPLRGQPGCVGQYAITPYSVAGEARAAWVSLYGIHETNGVNSRRLTNSLDWSATVNTASLATAVLHWNPSTLCLKFCYDSDGGGTNDKFLLLHMAPEHQGQDGPKVTGPFSATINCLASGIVSQVYRQYAGSTASGTVYLEESTGAEAVTVTTGRVYGPSKWWGVYKANLRHTAMAGQTASVTFSMVDDANGETLSIANSVALDTAQGTEFYVNRAGEYGQITISYSGSVAGAFLDVRAQVETQGEAGRLSA